MKENKQIKKIISHIEKISGGVEKNNQIPRISKKDFEKYIFDIENFIGSKISPLLINIWGELNGALFNNEIGIEVNDQIPTLEKGQFIEFTRFFTVEDKGDYVLEMLKSNNDIFAQKYIPFAEALEGDFFALNNEDNAIYYIIHDFNDDEKYAYIVSKNVESFFMSLQIIPPLSDNNSDKNEPKIISSNLSNFLFSKLQDFKRK
ncbi:SMI1/KNR4 family protein [Capnocytophaga canimorsus]|uniref:SMI1/KNR4 family protein n=1 Tax=Capnocytophaga canimorsus TaxID=28188 RepID=UPI0037CCFD60